MLFYRGRQRILDSNGDPVSGAKLNFYLTGTTTRADTYTDSDLTTEHANPVIASSAGFVEPIYLDPTVTYKCVITTSNGVTLPDGTVDPVSSSLEASSIGAALYQRSTAEIAASVTPTSYAPQQMVFVERYGAVGDGSTDDSAAIRMACSVLSDYGCLVFQSGKQYRFEPTLPNPYTGTGTQCGYVFNGKTGISVMAQGATFVTTTVGNAVLGLFTFYDCTDCVVYGGTSEGSYTPDSAWTGAYVAFMGLCKNCRLEDGSQRGGYALCCILDRTSTVSGVAANEPVDCYVSGHVQGTRRLCMFLGAGAGHRVDVRAGDVSRFYIEGIRGLTGSVTIRNTDPAYSNEKILITCSNAGVTENIDLLLNCDLAGANFVRFQNQDTSAISFKKIKLRGRVSGVPTSTGVSLGASSGGTGVTYEDIDLSELQVNVLSGAVRTVYVIPSHAITMRNITLPKVVTSAGTGNTVQIDNTAAATISFLRVPDGFYYRSTDSGSNLLLYSASGTVASMSTGEGGVFDYAGSGATPVQIANAAGLIVGKYRMLQNKTFYVVGSTNVSPYVGDQLSRGFVPAGAVTDATDYSSIESMLVTSGTATVNSLSRIVPGQKVTFSFNGGTPTFANGTNMKLAGGTNFVATQYDTLTLVCIDPPSGGPLETSTMIQAGADVNA